MKPLFSTGIASLDRLLGGGIPQRQTLIVTGDPGTGKTVLCSQIAFAHAARGSSVVLATLASEAQDKLMAELEGFSFFDADRVGNELFVVSAYPWVQKGPKEARDLLLKTVKERKAKLLFVDGVRSLRDLWQDEAKLRGFLYELNVGLAQLDAVALFTTEYPLRKLMEFPEATTVDGIVSLSALHFGGRVVRRVQVAKLRGRPHLTGEHLMHIKSEGITIVPRLEEVTDADQDFQPSAERCAFGLPELDEVINGGLPAMSTTLLAGTTGVGKTLLSAKFIATGAARGEPGLLVSYSEPVARLVARARAVAIDIEPLMRTGSMHVRYRASTNLEGDDLIAEILQQTRQLGIKRLVVDGIGEVEESILEKERVRGVLTSLIVQLRDLGVTTLFIKEVPKLAGPDVDFSDTPISITAENMLFFRQVELRGRLHRVLSVLKMRESGYDPHVREFEIGSEGLRVLGPLDSAEGLLTGVARYLPKQENDNETQGADRGR
jgi:circadian clock protein KaiC